MIDTLLVWRRGHFSSALNALKRTLLTPEEAVDLPATAVSAMDVDVA
jgi:hypothetical protein